MNEAAEKYVKTEFDMTKKERAKMAKKDATPVVDERKDVDDFKKVIENFEVEDAMAKPAPKKKPAGGPPAGFLDRQKKAAEKPSAPVAPKEEEKAPQEDGGEPVKEQ